MPKSIDNSTNNLTTGEAKLLALFIGVNRYQDEDLPNLRYCANDCEKLAAALETSTKLFPNKTIVFHRDDAEHPPVLKTVRYSLDGLIAKAGKLDTILIYFSGHGILEPETKEPILCLQDTRLSKEPDLPIARSTGLPVNELLEKMAASEAKYKLLFLDACHSGGLNFRQFVTQKKGTEKTTVPPANPTPELMALLQRRANQSEGFYALLSCDENQESLEFPELGHGLFTYYLIRGLLGEAADGHGVIEADGLYKYVYHRTLEYIDKTNKHIKWINQQKRACGEEETKPLSWQTPQRIVRGAGELVLGLVGREASGECNRRSLFLNSLPDCEETVSLAGIFSDRGGFEVDYFPGRVREALRTQHRSWRDALEAIRRCLRCEERNGQDFASAYSTAFLYFRAAMETSPEGESYLVLGDGVRLSGSFLRKLLRNSATDRLVVAFDCPSASREAMAEWLEDLQLEGDRSVCLLGAFRQSENSTEFAAALVRVLGKASPGFTVAEAIAELQQELNNPNSCSLPNRRDGPGSSQGNLNSDSIPPCPPYEGGSQREEVLVSGGERFLSWLSGAAIDLLLPAGESGGPFDSGICPYMGLQAFGKEDAFYFHGRETLAREILTGLQATSFLAVVGASGSGKSSVVRAGVLPLLEAGKQLPEKCGTVCLRPGREPIRALAVALARPGEAKEVEGLLLMGVESLVWRLRQREEPMVVLVVDQFEELFALAGESERQEFLTLLLGALKGMPDRLKVVITLREDFISACLEVPELGELVRASHVLVAPSLSEEEYREAIVEPARKVGLRVEEGLVEVLLGQVREAALALPLLQFALRQLWECREERTLSLLLYHERVGGLKGVLERKADEVLAGLSEEERDCARWIFLSLVHLGEGREDTRRRVLRSELLVDKYDRSVVMRVLGRLSQGRLVVIGAELDSPEGKSPLAPLGKGGTGDGGSPLAPLDKGGTGVPEVDGSKAPLVKGGLGGSQVSVEIAHEILIRHWSTLQWWLEENRSRLLLQRQAEGEAKKWERQGRSPDFLPRGAALRQAEELYDRYADELSPLTRQFIEEAIDLEKREEMARRQQRLRTISGLVGGLVAVSLFAAGALWQWRRAVVGERNAVIGKKNAIISFRISTLESLVDISLEWQLEAIALGKELQADWVNLENRVRGAALLQRTFDFEQWKEGNRFLEHQEDIYEFSFRTNSNLIASIRYGTLRLWKLDGTLVATLALEGHKGGVQHISFSPDGNLIASAGGEYDKTVRLWKLDGTAVATLEGHKGEVQHISFSLDGNLIASASDDSTIRLWKPDGTAVATLEGHQAWVSHISFSPDGNVIASASGDNTIRLWKSDGTAVATLEGHQAWVSHISFSPDGNLIVSASGDNTIRLWKSDGTAVATLEGHQDRIYQIGFSPDGNVIASASSDGILRLWKPDGTPVATLEGHKRYYSSYDRDNIFSFSPDGNIIASAGADNTVRLWKLDGTAVAILEGVIFSFSHDGNFIASAGVDNTVRLWKPDGTLVATLKGHQDIVRYVSFSPDGNLITFADGDRDNTVRLWKRDGIAIATLQGHEDYVSHVSFSPDGNLIASTGGDTMRLWKPDGTLVATLEGDRYGFIQAVFSPDGKLLASVGGNTVRLWKPDGTLVATLEEHEYAVSHVSFSPDGKLLASAGADKTVRLWKPDGTLVATLKGHQEWVWRVSFSPNGKLLASAAGNTVRLWKADGTAVATLEGHQDKVSHISFSPDGKLLASASYDNTVRLWKSDGTTIATLEVHRDRVLHVNFSPDGKLLATASVDNTVRLWKTDGTAVATLEEHLADVYHVSFSPDSKLLASASRDGTVRLWNLDLDSVLKQGCNWVRDYLSNNPNVSEEEKRLCDDID